MATTTAPAKKTGGSGVLLIMVLAFAGFAMAQVDSGEGGNDDDSCTVKTPEPPKITTSGVMGAGEVVCGKPPQAGFRAIAELQHNFSGGWKTYDADDVNGQMPPGTVGRMLIGAECISGDWRVSVLAVGSTAPGKTVNDRKYSIARDIRC